MNKHIAFSLTGAVLVAAALTGGAAAIDRRDRHIAADVSTVFEGPAIVEAAALRSDRRVPSGFTEQQTDVNGITMNYVQGGTGPTLVLLHGYPQTWWMWRDLLPQLGRHYTVIAPDLRGAGRSDAPRAGYDKKTLAADVAQLLAKLNLDQDVRLVGHDIGVMVAYAYAAAHPDNVTKLVLAEAPIPDSSLYSFSSLTPQGPGFWNFGFFSLRNGLPEATINGREREWVDGFTDWIEVNKDGIDERDVREYARWLRDDAHLRASFEYFRALPQDVADNQVYAQTPLTMPVLAIGAEFSLGESVPAQVRQYATNVQEAIIPGSGHWIFEEQPDELTRVLINFLR